MKIALSFTRRLQGLVTILFFCFGNRENCWKFEIKITPESYNKTIIDLNFGYHKDLSTSKSDIHLGLRSRSISLFRLINPYGNLNEVNNCIMLWIRTYPCCSRCSRLRRISLCLSALSFVSASWVFISMQKSHFENLEFWRKKKTTHTYEGTVFLTCCSMKYRDFSVKLNTISVTVWNSEKKKSDFHCSGLLLLSNLIYVHATYVRWTKTNAIS